MRTFPHLFVGSAPRAIMGAVRAAAAITPQTHPGAFHADGTPKTTNEIAAELAVETNGLGQWRRDIDAALDTHSRQIAAYRLNGGGEPPRAALDPEYSRVFSQYARRGGSEDDVRTANATGDRARVQAAMSAGSNNDGGYLAPVEWDRQIHEAQRAVSPMRRISTVQETSVGAFSTLWNNEAWGSGWVGETATRPQTTTASLAPIVFASGEIYAQPAITQKILDDAAIDLGKWIAEQLASEFDRQEGIAFVSGDGVNKPAGFLSYIAGGANATTHPGGALDLAPSGDAAALKPDGLIDLTYGLAAPYRQNATWVMNSMTAASVRKMKDGQGGYLWQESYVAGQPSTLLGRPVVLDENMPNVAAGNTPIAYGDFRTGYLINDRIGTRILRDPYTAKPYVLFYTTKRVGGGVLDPRAIRVLKVAAA